MLINNTGLIKDIKIAGVLTRITPGINIFEDLPVLRDIVKLHPDLSIITDPVENTAHIIKEVNKDISEKNVSLESVEHVIQDVGNILKHNEEDLEASKESDTVEGEDSAISINPQDFKSSKKSRKGQKNG